MGLTLSQAAEQTNKSKSVLSKAINGGKLSATKQDDGSYDIDPVELDRWVKHVVKERKKKPVQRTDSNLEILIENRELKAQLTAANEEKNLWKQQVSDLRSERDDWKGQAQTLLLGSATRQTPPGLFVRLWNFLFGKGKPA